VADLGGQEREVEAVGVVDDSTRKVKVVISQITPELVVQSWQEVADF